MTSANESIKIGLSNEERKKIEAWLLSPEGQKAVSDTLKDIQKTIAEMRKAGEIPRYILHTPMDL